MYTFFVIQNKIFKMKLDQYGSQTAASHVSTTFLHNVEFIGRPIHKEKKSKKRRKTNPKTQSRKKKNRNKPWNLSWNKTEKENHGGTQPHDTEDTNPTTLPGSRWNQHIRTWWWKTMPQPGKQFPEPYLEPGNEDGTERQRTRETSPGTLPETKRNEDKPLPNSSDLKPHKQPCTCFQAWLPHGAARCIWPAPKNQLRYTYQVPSNTKQYRPCSR